jgi:hypothetical protein
MKLRPKYRLVEHFAEIDDPRIERTKRHKLTDILTIAILAVICGAEGWVGMENFGKAKHQWLKKYWNCRMASLPRYFCACVCASEPRAISRLFSALGQKYSGGK